MKDNEKISLELKKIKFKFDIKSFDIFIETKSPKFIYKESYISIDSVKAYADFFSIIKSKPEIKKVNIKLNEIDIKELKNILIKTKPSSLKSLVINKVKSGKVILNLELYFKDKLNLESFIAKGEVKNINITIDKNLNFKNTNFNFFADASDILIKNINSEMNGLSFEAGDMQIKRDKKTTIKSNFLTKIKINKDNISYYSSILKDFKFINNETSVYANLNNFLEITFDETFEITNFIFKNNGEIKQLLFKFNKPFQSNFIDKDISNLYLKNSSFNTSFGLNMKNKITTNGQYSFNDTDYYKFDIKNSFYSQNLDTNLNFELAQKVKVDLINYRKNSSEIAKIFLNFEKKKDLINIKEFEYIENKNSIFIENLKLKKDNLISFEKINVKTFDGNIVNNDFSIKFKKDIKIKGNKYDATQLNKLLQQKSKNNFLKKVNKNIEIDLKAINTPLSEKLKNFRLIGVFEKGKFVKISSKGDFGNNKFLDISMKNNKVDKKKYLEVYSDLPQPLLSEYNFFKGLTGGILTFSSIIEDDNSSSKLVIDNFKLVNAPGAVKLLSLADFGGLADLAGGEGLSFEKMEIKLSNKNGFLELSELYAVGPSISVLMEGYKANDGLTSLKGTLVPAKNLNKLLSKIPVIGKIIIPKEVGEGLFGVSFKMKGMPGEIKTTINPIKTLTPRFITKALEKSKTSK